MFAAAPFDFGAGPQLTTKKALLLIDLQNDFVDQSGKLFVPNTTDFLPKLPQLIRQFRSKGDIFFISTAYDEPRSIYSDATGGYGLVLKSNLTSRVASVCAEGIGDEGEQQTPTPAAEASHVVKGGILNKDVEAFLTPPYNSQASWSQCCVPHSNGALMPGILSSAIDRNVDMEIIKTHYSPFTDASFLLHLRMQLVTELYVCGALSNISVYATVIDAVSHGMSVTIIEDCVGYRDERCHREAMCQMADSLGANGIDHQELLDDLAGLLGDVVHEEDFHTHHHVAFQRGLQSTDKPDPKKKAAAWLSSLEESTSEAQDAGPHSQEALLESDPPSAEALRSRRQDTEPLSDLGPLRQQTPDSPPRKRHFDDEEPDVRGPKLHTRRRASHEGHIGEGSVAKAKQVRRQRPQVQDRRRSPTPLKGLRPPIESKSTGDIPRTSVAEPTVGASALEMKIEIELKGEVTAGPRDAESAPKEEMTAQQPTKMKKAPSPRIRELGSPIASDSFLLHDILPSRLSSSIFTDLKREISFQKMHHRSGEVPRLVAVQGLCTPTAIPIYRHPADTSPPLLPFTPTVQLVRSAAEEAVGHPLNHVLIQLYRGPEDGISEHADKTLDIVRGSKIVNYSAGALRTMVLRSKKAAMSTSDVEQQQQQQSGGDETGEVLADAHEQVSPGPPRQVIRVPLLHNSLFVLGPETNRRFLHAIRPDRRMSGEKVEGEVVEGGQRISLTFRHVGTFLSPDGQRIWGQGAREKQREAAGRVVRDAGEYERMIRAFGQENRRGKSWEWEELYGSGFDVVDAVGVETSEDEMLDTVEGKRNAKDSG